MKKVRLALSIVVGFMGLSGCASQIGAFFNRPVVQDTVPGAVATFAQTSDRRTVIVALSASNEGKVCAEPPPDSATALKTDLQASFESTARKLSLGDQFQTTVSVLSDRTSNLDAFRTGVYALCQFNLNGALNGQDVKDIFLRLADNFAEVERSRPASPARAAGSGSALVGASAAGPASSPTSATVTK